MKTSLNSHLTIDKNFKDSHPALLQGAMDSEIQLLVSFLEDVTKETIFDYPFYKGFCNGHPVIVQKTFQGMTNAAASTMLAIEHFSPAFIINQGICGGHSPKLHRGDLLLGQDIINYSNFKIGMTDASNPLIGCECIGCEIPKDFPKTSDNQNTASGEKTTRFFSDEALLRIAESTPMPDGCQNMLTGTIASADAWLDRKDLIALMNETFGTCGEDMETASVAQLCLAYKIPLLSIRMLSNTRVHDEEYDESVADRLQEYTWNVLCNILKP